METPLRMVCVDDEENVLRALKRMFMEEHYEILTAPSGAEGLALLHSTAPIQVVVSDYRMPGMNGVEFLREVCALWPRTIRIVLSGYADTSAVVAAINEGQIYRFIPKPWNDDELKVTIANAFELYALHEKNIRLSDELKKRNEELLSLNMILKERITDKIGQLESQNRELLHEQSMLRFLPFPVVGLDRNGTWISYFNEKAKSVFGWAKYDHAPVKRQDVFASSVNSAIDGLLLDNAAPAAVTINQNAMTVRCEWVGRANGEKKPVLVFCDAVWQNV